MLREQRKPNLKYDLCPSNFALKLFGGKWKTQILWHLYMGKSRPSEFLKEISKNSDVSRRVLTRQLNELIEDGILEKKVYPEVPPKVEYNFTEIGKKAAVFLWESHHWGIEYLDKKNIKHLFSED